MRRSGNDAGLVELATQAASAIAAGHVFVIVLRDGFPLVLRVGDDGRVNAIKVRVGRRVGDRIEILAGVTPTMRLVASGGAFLSEGDKVKVVPNAASGAGR